MKFFISIPSLLVFLFSPVVGAQSQTTLFRPVISASVIVDSAAYSRAKALQSLVFPGTPVTVNLHVHNPVAPQIDGAIARVVVERGWFNQAQIRILRGSPEDNVRDNPTEITCIPLHPVPGYQPTLDGVLENGALRPGADVTLKCLLDPVVVDGLPVGEYTVDVRWKTQGGTNQQLRPHPAESFKTLQGFSVRAVESVLDQLDVELRYMTFALRQERFTEALQFANRVLLAEPSSLRALIVRGEANTALKRCREANADFERAAVVAELRADVNARPTGQDPLRSASALRGRIAQCQ